MNKDNNTWNQIISSSKNPQLFKHKTKDISNETKQVLSSIFIPTKVRGSNPKGGRPFYSNLVELKAWAYRSQLQTGNASELALNSQESIDPAFHLAFPSARAINQMMLDQTEAVLLPIERMIIHKLLECNIPLHIQVDLCKLRHTGEEAFYVAVAITFALPLNTDVFSSLSSSSVSSSNATTTLNDFTSIITYINMLTSNSIQKWINNENDNVSHHDNKQVKRFVLYLGLAKLGSSHPSNIVVQGVKLLLDNHHIPLTTILDG